MVSLRRELLLLVPRPPLPSSLPPPPPLLVLRHPSRIRPVPPPPIISASRGLALTANPPALGPPRLVFLRRAALSLLALARSTPGRAPRLPFLVPLHLRLFLVPTPSLAPSRVLGATRFVGGALTVSGLPVRATGSPRCSPILGIRHRNVAIDVFGVPGPALIVGGVPAATTLRTLRTLRSPVSFRPLRPLHPLWSVRALLLGSPDAVEETRELILRARVGSPHRIRVGCVQIRHRRIVVPIRLESVRTRSFQSLRIYHLPSTDEMTSRGSAGQRPGA